jgi:hypothetical protein
MAIACLRLLTFPPLPPLPRLSVPRLRLRMALLTSFDALREYLRAMKSSRSVLRRVPGLGLLFRRFLSYAAPGAGLMVPEQRQEDDDGKGNTQQPEK